MTTFAAVLITLLAPLSVVLVLVTMPGTWILLAVALVFEVFLGGFIGWKTLGVCAGLTMLGEIIELVASAAGAKKAGGSKRAAVGSILGALVGAIAASALLAFLFPLSPILGGAVGAGVGALLAEKTIAERGWKHAAKVGTGAAIGRLIATACKSAIAAIVAIIVVYAAWFYQGPTPSTGTLPASAHPLP